MPRGDWVRRSAKYRARRNGKPRRNRAKEPNPIDHPPTTPKYTVFRPLPKQYDFYRAAWGRAYLLYAGGYGSGKTAIGCYLSISLSCMYPGNFGLIGREHASDLRDTTQRTFFEMLPQGWIRKYNKSENHVYLKNGSEVIFRHLDDSAGLKSLNLGWVYIDEITDTSEPVFRMLQSRIRLPAILPAWNDVRRGWPSNKRATEAEGVDGRRIFATTNTDAPGHWVHELWFGPPQPAGRGLPVEKRFDVNAPSHENRHVPAEYLADMDASFDPKYHERYVQGKWIDIGRDRVYHQFGRETHTKPVPYDEHIPLVHAWDFNVNPMATVILQQAGDETRVIDEIVLGTSNTPEVCDEFLRRYGAHRAGVHVYGDATGHTRGATTGKSDYAHIAEKYQRLPGFALVVPRANPPEVDRVAAVNARLRSNDGVTHAVVDPKCNALVTDFERVAYKTGARAIDRPSGPQIDKGADAKLTHVSDAFGYYIAHKFPVRRPGPTYRQYNVPGV